MIHRLQFYFVENLAFCRARLENEEMPILRTDVELAIAQHQRGFLNGAKVLFPELFPRIDVESENIGSRIHMIDALTVNHWGCRAQLEIPLRPENLLLADGPLGSRIHCRQQTHLT